MDAVKKKLAILKEEKEAAVAHAEDVERQKKELQDQLDKVRANEFSHRTCDTFNWQNVVAMN